MTSSSRLSIIKNILEKGGYPIFRFEQIRTAIYSDQFGRYSDISTLPKNLKEQLINELGEEILSLKKVYDIKGEQAHKVLFQTRDGHQIESVRLSYKSKHSSAESRIAFGMKSERPHHSLCISTQSGCALGCLFCATGAIGFKKNLSADEILDQVLYFLKNDMQVDSVIFMGMGEPLSNPDNTFEAIDLITSPEGLNFSPRRLSLSTVGIVPGIERLTTKYPNVNLAFSLHNPFNDERAKIMPITNAYPIEKVMTAIDHHLATTNHKVFIAYILLKDINDSPRHALALANLLKATPDRLRLLHVNLIRYNSGNTLTAYQKPTNSTVERFQEILTKNKIHHTLRQDFGTDINAACGQLAANYQKKAQYKVT